MKPKTLLPIILGNIVLGMAVTSSVVAATTTPESATHHDPSPLEQVQEDFDLDLATHHPQVQSHQRKFQQRTDLIEKTVSQAEPYLNYIAQELENKNLPLELILLPFIESNYNPHARSYMGALGLWQLMPATARRFGVSHEGRRDIKESTRAALTYINYLAKIFNKDWLLVMAAYNAGEGTVGRAIRRNRAAGKPTDFWALNSLPLQTKQYVHKILALASIIADPERYNVELPKARLKEIQVSANTSISQLAKTANVSAETIYKLNPGLKRAATPQEIYTIWLPVADAHRYQEKTEQPEKSVLTKLASVLNTKIIQTPTTVDNTTLSRADVGNPVAVRNTVDVDNTDMDNTKDNLKTQNKNSENTNTTNYVQYQVRSGDSLYRIAQKFKVAISDISRWNQLNKNGLLYPGQQLIVYLPRVQAHVNA